MRREDAWVLGIWHEFLGRIRSRLLCGVEYAQEKRRGFHGSEVGEFWDV